MPLSGLLHGCPHTSPPLTLPTHIPKHTTCPWTALLSSKLICPLRKPTYSDVLWHHCPVINIIIIKHSRRTFPLPPSCPPSGLYSIPDASYEETGDGSHYSIALTYFFLLHQYFPPQFPPSYPTASIPSPTGYQHYALLDSAMKMPIHTMITHSIMNSIILMTTTM